jgi:hypothetical protein
MRNSGASVNNFLAFFERFSKRPVNGFCVREGCQFTISSRFDALGRMLLCQSLLR